MAQKNSAEYLAWRDMKRRCLDPRDKDWNRYGGRGISVCPRWAESFASFMADVGEKPEPRRSFLLARNDNDGHYEPGNVEWQSRDRKMNNCGLNRWLDIGGERMTLSQAARRFDVTKHGIRSRLCKGLSAEAATHPSRPSARSRHGVITTHKLQPNQIPLIRQRLDAGENCATIARSVGVATVTIRNIKHGKSWRTV